MNSKRIQEIQSTTAYPDSNSVAQALKQVWNECGHDFKKSNTYELSLARARIDVLEGENAKLVEVLGSTLRLQGQLETASGIDYTLLEDDLIKANKEARDLLNHKDTP